MQFQLPIPAKLLNQKCFDPRSGCITLMLLSAFVAQTGCRSRAYNDLYVENMAAEIRDLEDQLYEYDYEYRLLEQELATLRAQNAQLEKGVAPNGQSQSRRHGGFEQAPSGDSAGSHSPLEFYSPSGPTLVPEPVEGQDASGAYSAPGSILEGESVIPEEANQGLGEANSELPPPRNSYGDPSGPASGSASPRENRAPESPFRQYDSPADPGSNDGSGDFDLDGLVPPTIEPGEPMPPPLPVRTDNVQNSPGPANALELNLGRIQVPAQLASQRKRKPASSTAPQPDELNRIAIEDSTTNRHSVELEPDDEALSLEPSHATISPAQRQVTDTRVVELAFHPTLSRAANFDDVTDDDGLYLVLQPRNAQGQVVPIAADLAIVILDPAREGDAARIGRRDFSANEVRAKMQPRGTNQGVHLRLPWNGPDPSADRVIVFARYTFPDGRQVVGEKTFFVSNDSGLKTVWAPRGNPNARLSGQNQISDANPSAGSSTVQARNQGAVRMASGVSNSKNSASQTVVRPAVGTSTSSAAPQPSGM